jgi:hypothetical protein
MPADGPPNAPVVEIDDDALNLNLRTVFNPILDAENPMEAANAGGAYVNLAGMFVHSAYPELRGHIAFDHISLREVFRRFDRDAFGVMRFCAMLDELEGACVIQRSTRQTIQDQLRYVGIRINTEDPRKTKVAAAFTLWACAMRPVYVRNMVISGIAVEELNTFCASLNFWVACSYLSMFGDVALPSDDDALVRLSRIRYDLTYRNLNLSSLEMLYASIFKLKEAPVEESGDLLSFQDAPKR